MSIQQFSFYGLVAAAIAGALFLMTYFVVAMGMVFFKATGIRLPLPQRINHKTKLLLKWFHLFSAASWFGSAVTLVAVSQITARSVTKPCGLDVVASALMDMDRWVIIPMALSTIGSGLLLAFFSGYNFRFNWVWAKAAGGFWTLVMGWSFITPMIEAMAAKNYAATVHAAELSGLSIFPPVFYVMGAIQFSLLVCMLLLSVFKPGSKSLLAE